MQCNEQPWRSPETDKGLSALLIDLARDVRDVVRDGPSEPEEIACLNDRIIELRESMNSRSDTPLDRWFENLQRELGPSSCEPTIH